MTFVGRIIATVVVAIAVAAPVVLVRATDVELAPTIHHRMSRYVDAKFGFSFWYPSVLRITVAAANDEARFPGGVVVEILQVRPAGGILLYVVNSPQSTITDEPNGHAAPIPQTKYFYDAASQRWMVTYPEGTDGGGSAAPAPADVSKTTIGGLPMLPSVREPANAPARTPMATGAAMNGSICPREKYTPALAAAVTPIMKLLVAVDTLIGSSIARSIAGTLSA